MSMLNLAIIPARGGSKRIPKKNIKYFLGKPIIAYSIEAALNSNLFEEVIVSTDCQETAEIAISYGAKVLIRSNKNSDDFATLSDVIEEVKKECINNKLHFKAICCLLATAPLVTSELIKKGYNSLMKSNADSVRPVVRFAYPIQRALKLIEGKVSFINEEYSTTRSQDLEPTFFDSGMFYWMKFELGLKGNIRHAFEIKEIQAQDIDTFQDWQIAELKYKINNQ